MRVVITGGAGFLGVKLARALLERGELIGPTGGPEPIDELVLFDAATSSGLVDPRLRAVSGDIADGAAVRRLIGNECASVFHLAATVSTGAEADFDLGYRVNLDGTRHVLEACRALPRPPRLVFASSIAVYGGDLPETVTDTIIPAPQTSYGTQKLASEYLIADYSRKGHVDGRSLRLPTVSVRPGKPNRAASTWASSIIREPLSGVDAVCPVHSESRMALLSPRRVIVAFLRVHDLAADRLGPRRSLLLSGIPVSASEMAAAVERHAGNRKLGRIHWRPDAMIQKIVDGWPKATDSAQAAALGFAADADIDEIVRAFITDDLNDQIASLRASA